MTTLDVAHWLGNFYLLATLLLTCELLACRFAGQPVRRMALARATAVGLVVLAMLCALPGWSSIHLLSPAPVNFSRNESLKPLVGQAIQQNMGLQPPLPADSPLPPPPLNAESVPFKLVIDWSELALYAFLAGSAIVILWLALGAWQVRRLRRKAKSAPDKIATIVNELTPSGMPLPSLGVLENLPVAVAVGLRNPAILLPRTLVDEASPLQMRTVLAHELAHLRHRDLWLLAGVRLLLVLLWANPLFWLWRRRVRLDQEVLADTAAAELTSRSVYAEELVELARYASVSRVPRLASSVGLWETRSQLKRRLALLLDEKLTIVRSCSRSWRVGSLVALLGLAGGLSLVTLTPGELQEEDAQTSYETVKSADSGIIAPEKNVALSRVDTEVKESHIDISSALSPETFLVETNATFKQLYEDRKPNTITGICVDEKGEPLADVKVEVYSALFKELDSEPKIIRSTTTDAEGRYQFENVIDIQKEFPEGSPDDNYNYFLPEDIKVITVISREPGRAPGFFGNSDSSHVARHGQVNLHRMVPAQTLRGRIVDEQGEPVVGAGVSAGYLPTIRGFPQDINTAITDNDGKYAIDDLEDYDAEEERKKYQQMQERDSLDLQLYAGNDRKPWARWLWAKHPEFAMKRAGIEKVPGHIDVELQPGAVLTGRVVTQEAGKSPVPARNVEVRLQREMTPEWGYEFNYQSTGSRTDNEGKYRFDSLPQGKYSCSPQNAGWVSHGIEGIELKQGETTEAPDAVMTRGGRVRIQLIDDETGKPLTFENPTKGFVSPGPRPPRKSFYFPSKVVEFSPTGIGEQQVPAGKYTFFVNLPGKVGEPGWQGVDAARIQTPEDLDKLPVFEVKEGEVLDIAVRMQREQPRVNGKYCQIVLPSDDAKQAEPKQEEDTEFTPATPPADAEDKDAYENGIFVPDPDVQP